MPSMGDPATERNSGTEAGGDRRKVNYAPREPGGPVTAPTHPTPRPLPPAPWPVEGLTQGAVVLQRLVEAVRALELAVWGLKLDQALDAAGMPRVLHRIDASPGEPGLACRPEGGAPARTQQVALRVER